ncbi:2-C-methyl-D-erythritol 4-phosphate cytidylyltransferase 1 [Slackia heliotrinireducens]|uniref:4-diphosphocytidyl-2-methyl-D-erythritol synthase n=1 Tax=Slackia heliotrinireducens (strain ATCC 29202 / DSM 20476 / NCTC 11029 / RHS 1) TaxID=471855 RepID=C7N5T3_SLAHD|nr:2-C-methyl-D-erythritol 4-phosphate cytidylyltransferase [Slackia heliotrinireducens]ACV22268.1 4-diphosphocytidyl-2-methyl-D-erythritol synthase [Slackia heliotrinireducens DSM 20476]VEH00437.1 2-C-methyl-D-erythritol 4-phosphate cytidylyltransferase 1 [Slackia heliotrinireducens]
MIVAMVLAGGTGNRVGAGMPKQFIKVLGKPVLAYTLEEFQKNENIDAIELVCHAEWIDEAKSIIEQYGITKAKWICRGGDTYQGSTANGVLNLKDVLADDDILVSAFGAAPMVAQEDIDDSIRVCKLHGNGISSTDIDLCTCEKADEESSTVSVVRETLKGFANPWTFRYGELRDAYEHAIATGMLDELEPHTTSLYFALGKRIWFSKFTSPQVKITRKSDIDFFEGWLLLQERRKNQASEG